jgi:hypothetical protein
MSQTTGHITLRNVSVEISPDGVTWTSIAGTTNSLDLSGGERDTGEVYTAEGDLPLVGAGKMKLTKVKLKIVYSETISEGWRKFWDAFKNSTDMYLRYAPKGYFSGNVLFTSGKGFVTEPSYPQGDVGDGKPLLVETSFTGPGFTDSIIS